MPTTGEMAGVWIAMLLTFAIYSFLYKDNPVFKFAEHLFVGLGTGYGVCYAWFEVIYPSMLKPLYRAISSNWFHAQLSEPLDKGENLWLFVPAFFGLLLLLRLIPKLAWMSRWSFAFILGTGCGMSIPLTISASIFKQMEVTMRPLWGGAEAAAGGIGYTIGMICILVGVITVLGYFFFSLEHKGAMKPVASIGIYFIMISFGAAFGYTIMARQSLAIGRFQEIIADSKRDYWYASIVALALVVVMIAVLEIMRIAARKREGAPRQEA